MNKSLYMTQKTKEIKDRLRLGIEKYEVNEVNLAEKMGVGSEQGRYYIKKIDRVDLNYKLPSIMRLHTALDLLGIPKTDEPKGE
jgi:hypothetical protein